MGRPCMGDMDSSEPEYSLGSVKPLVDPVWATWIPQSPLSTPESRLRMVWALALQAFQGAAVVLQLVAAALPWAAVVLHLHPAEVAVLHLAVAVLHLGGAVLHLELEELAVLLLAVAALLRAAAVLHLAQAAVLHLELVVLHSVVVALLRAALLHLAKVVSPVSQVRTHQARQQPVG